MPHAANIIPLSTGVAFPFVFLFFMGIITIANIVTLCSEKNKMQVYKTLCMIEFPLVSITLLLCSIFITIMLYNFHIEDNLYDKLNELAHKPELSQYEQIYFNTELEQLAQLEKQYPFSITSTRSFSWADPPETIFIKEAS